MADNDLNNGEQQDPQADQDFDLEAIDKKADSEGSNKVELDLDDAPFLEEEEEPVEPESKEETKEIVTSEVEETPRETRLQKLLKRKKILIGAGAGLVLIIALALFLLLSGGDPEPEPPPPPPPVQIEEPQELPPIEAKPGEVLISWEQFWVEYTDDNGETRFLVCKLSAPTTNPDLKFEADMKTLAIRDSIYYYLSHKPKTFLSNQKNADVLKSDLLGVINAYLTGGELTQIYIESYLIR